MIRTYDNIDKIEGGGYSGRNYFPLKEVEFLRKRRICQYFLFRERFDFHSQQAIY